jgi:hypothetical protein
LKLALHQLQLVCNRDEQRLQQHMQHTAVSSQMLGQQA